MADDGHKAFFMLLKGNGEDGGDVALGYCVAESRQRAMTIGAGIVGGDCGCDNDSHYFCIRALRAPTLDNMPSGWLMDLVHNPVPNQQWAQEAGLAWENDLDGCCSKGDWAFFATPDACSAFAKSVCEDCQLC